MFSDSPSPEYYEPADVIDNCSEPKCSLITELLCDNCGLPICEEHAVPSPDQDDKYLCASCEDAWLEAQKEIEADDAWEPSYDAPGYNLPY